MVKDVEGVSDDFFEQLEAAQHGKGSRHFEPIEALKFAKFALSKGFGVSKLEAYGTGSSRGKQRLWHQILGVDEFGENWDDHRDPKHALEVFRQKLQLASDDRLGLRYKFWLSSA